jgi:hypothetical protein
VFIGVFAHSGYTYPVAHLLLAECLLLHMDTPLYSAHFLYHFWMIPSCPAYTPSGSWHVPIQLVLYICKSIFNRYFACLYKVQPCQHPLYTVPANFASTATFLYTAHFWTFANHTNWYFCCDNKIWGSTENSKRALRESQRLRRLTSQLLALLSRSAGVTLVDRVGVVSCSCNITWIPEEALENFVFH